jgi:hypothetical protein
LWIGDRRIRSERCITLHTVRSLGVGPLIATTMPHARGFDPGRHDPPETRERDAPNDEDGRALRLSAADQSATEFYPAMIAPSGARPSVTKRQIAIRSLRAKATIVMRRIRP